MKLMKILFYFALPLLIAIPVKARVILSGYYSFTLMDQIQLVVCAPEYCSLDIMRSVAEVFTQEFKANRVPTDFTGSTLCGCNNPSRPLEELMTKSKAEFVRDMARSYTRVLLRQNPSRYGIMTDQIANETKTDYAAYIEREKGKGAFLKLQIESAKLLGSLPTLQGQSLALYQNLVLQGFNIGSIYNHVQVPRGCVDSDGFHCLNESEITAARRYMGVDFVKINESLYLGTGYTGPWATTIKNLTSLLRKLKPARTISFRGTGPFDYFKNFKVGDIYKDPAFVSTSLNSQISQRFLGGVGLIMYTKNCPLISGAGSLFEGEHEVLCPPNTSFRVVHREYRWGNLYLILDEI